MVDAVLVDHTVGVVHPAIGGAVMVGRAVIVLGGGIEGIGELNLLIANRLLIKTNDLHRRRTLAFGQGEGDIVVDAIDGQTDVEPRILGAVAYEAYLHLGLTLLDGEEEVALWAIDLNAGQRVVGVEYLHSGWVGLLRAADAEGEQQREE